MLDRATPPGLTEASEDVVIAVPCENFGFSEPWRGWAYIVGLSISSAANLMSEGFTVFLPA